MGDDDDDGVNGWLLRRPGDDDDDDPHISMSQPIGDDDDDDFNRGVVWDGDDDDHGMHALQPLERLYLLMMSPIGLFYAATI